MSKVFIRAGATTGANNGTSWADAFKSFAFAAAAGYSRSNTYYVAGGNYSETATISVAPSGSTWLVIKKANAADNSSDPGWDASYATTVATIQCVFLNQSYISLDGVTGSGTSGHGIHVYQTSTAAGRVIFLDTGRQPFILAHIDIEGPGSASSGNAIDGIYYSTTTVKGLYVHHCWIHETTTNGVVLSNCAGTSYSDYGFLFENNVISETGLCTELGNHGQGMQLGGGVSQQFNIIRNNVFRNIAGTGIICYFTGANNISNSDQLIYNNIFYRTSGAYSTFPGLVWWEGGKGGTYTGCSFTNLYFANNAGYGVSQAPIYLVGPATFTNIVSKNNIFEASVWDSANLNVTTESNNGAYGNSGSFAPSNSGSATTFVSAGDANFYLVANGYAIGTAANLDTLFDRYADDTLRTVPWNMGPLPPADLVLTAGIPGTQGLLLGTF